MIDKLTWNHIGYILSLASVGSFIVFTFIVSIISSAQVKPIRILLGLESKQAYLSRMVNGYPAIQYINENLPESGKIWMVWDGRSYYCDRRCDADVDQIRWTTLFMEYPDIGQIKQYLEDNKVTHILYSKADANYFIIGHDPSGIHKNAEEFLLHKFIPNCGKQVYQDASSVLYKLSFDMPACHE